MPSKGTKRQKQFSRRVALKAAGAMVGTSALSTTAAARGSRNKEENSDQDEDYSPRITAHRGYRDVFPQNTLAAMEGSSQIGADRIEIDIMPCREGEIVVFHDNSLDSLTDKEGIVGDTSCETVLDAEVLETGETIPTLAEVLDAVKPSITMNIEFKSSFDYSWEYVAKRALDIASGYSGDFYVSSFSRDALKAVRKVDSDVDVAKLFGSNKNGNLEFAREIDAEAVNPSLGVLDRDVVETAHEEGREVNVYTVDNWREARQPIELNVDSLIADIPTVLEHFELMADSDDERDDDDEHDDDEYDDDDERDD